MIRSSSALSIGMYLNSAWVRPCSNPVGRAMTAWDPAHLVRAAAARYFHREPTPLARGG